MMHSFGVDAYGSSSGWGGYEAVLVVGWLVVDEVSPKISRRWKV